MRKEPQWVTPFLRALERTGQARTAAEDAGIDHSTAYQRRRAHPEFAAAWRGAVAAHKARVKKEEAEEIAAVRQDPSTIHSAVNGPSNARMSPGHPARFSPRAQLREDLVISGGQVKRAGHDRWSARKEKIYFEELAATANAQRAAAAARVSTQAVDARRLKHPLFRAKWEAVVRTARASIDLYLIEQTNKAFDPATLDTGDVAPRATIDQAIKISQIGASKAKGEGERNPFDDPAEAMDAAELEELRARVLVKLQRLAERRKAERLAEGWTLDERHGLMIPPDYVKRPGCESGEPDEGRGDLDASAP